MSHLSHLETVLTWEGAIDNERIRQLLDVKAVWASRLMGELVQRMGRRARRASAHAPLESCDPKASRRSPDEYLRTVNPAQDPAIGGIVEDARVDLSPVSPQVFSTLFRAVRQQTGVRIVYRSMNSPAGTERVIYPHAFVRAPRRWHVRAWCAQRQGYRDFTLGRMAAAERLDAPNSHPQTGDAEWLNRLELVIVAHPALSAAQQDMIAQEYFPGGRAMRLRVRECLAGYAIQDLRLATDAFRQAPPDYQLLVSNAAKLPPLFVQKQEPV
ncbi:MAG: WYL domain-containing protein [Ramlibacter sp.]|nr:WYL domain-containing protein [Ramlibacter sp.]